LDCIPHCLNLTGASAPVLKGNIMPNTKAVGVAYSDPQFDSITVVGASTVDVTDASTGSTNAAAVTTTLTLTGAGAVGWASKSDLEANVALGAYANGLYGYLAFGASGRVTGLASGTVGEVVLSAGCTQGTYAAFEAEIGMPSGAVTGTNTSFFYLSTYGADKATFDTSGTLFNLAGVTKGTGKFLQDTTAGSTARPVQVLKVVTPDGIRYLPLYSTVAIAA
jgi:hypothetical protein